MKLRACENKPQVSSLGRQQRSQAPSWCAHMAPALRAYAAGPEGVSLTLLCSPQGQGCKISTKSSLMDSFLEKANQFSAWEQKPPGGKLTYFRLVYTMCLTASSCSTGTLDVSQASTMPTPQGPDIASPHGHEVAHLPPPELTEGRSLYPSDPSY